MPHLGTFWLGRKMSQIYSGGLSTLIYCRSVLATSFAEDISKYLEQRMQQAKTYSA